MKSLCLSWRLLFLSVIGLAIASDARSQETGTKVYLSGMKSAVQVIVPDGKGRAALGSGSVVNLAQGYILTNWHVVREAPAEVLVIFPIWEKGRPILEKDKYKEEIKRVAMIGKVLVSDERVDLAIIKLIEPARIPKGTVSVKFSADSPFQGSKVVSIGNPGASDSMWVYTPGEVRSVYKKKWLSGDGTGKQIGDHEAKIIEATSATSPGDSGGPCFNEKGEQVGVTQGGLSAKVAQGFSYFIDATDVKTFLKKNKVIYNAANDTAPPEMTDPMVAVDTKKDPPKKDLVADDTAKLEKDAANRLNLIRPLTKDPSRKSFAVEQLQKIINSYPKTEAAKEAHSLLKQIQ